MPMTRMRMRPWLELQINSNAIPGLIWINKERKMFQIPWKHAARHGWNMDTDASLFRNWAIHTGRFRQGIDSPEPKTWKANFRCAMNSLPDIEEVKDKSVNKGSSAIRVYRMLPPVDRSKQKEKKCRSTKDSKSKSRKREFKSKVKLEVTEPVTPKLPVDHTTYTAPEQSTSQEMVVDSTVNIGEFSSSESCPIVDWSINEIVGESEDRVVSTCDLYPFQISPMPSPAAASAADSFLTIDEASEITQESSQWEHSSIEGKGYLSNVIGTMPLTPFENNLVTNEQEAISHLTFQDGNWSDSTGGLELRFSTDRGGDLLNWVESVNWSNGSLISCT
ncbi:interferon regulatory factor 1-like isoform X1 [Rhincodon typus]|uniref:interferon regulatory factor 1-like isoform X1 n=1 Tax=Rhincodon typus TaxID=259920 RepID=UPI0009A3A90B|nr:interferon regulatory factor 1-like isoform X1 [Rhincodon typus]XP_048459380.1 interferon regulatory factor 1-like isoform X1 [Rhincodon typus]XP_048459381.1 interferon regulatory factor 1-like isoform X1 [Rhincodon typus]XP_048459382.1 interferon regulatory factor 1-like isoform X1 [Rhincodon typus]XP_048459383.1 interferon regulatory factor 1-like isoform X1 [Rhincodon typus]XP_048459384.1 interferon regulatory factor 1-like isoform X1 [Rhincodon typus]